MKWPFVSRKRYDRLVTSTMEQYYELRRDYEVTRGELDLRTARVQDLLRRIAEREVRDRRRVGTRR